MLVRKMTQDDIAEVCTLERRCFPNPWVAEGFEAEMEGPASFAEVVMEGEALAGYATYRVIVDEAHLLNIAISPELRGRGLGKRLLRHILRVCVNEGAEWMFLEVRPSNVEALGLYRAHGFHQLGVRERYYANGEDAILMASMLNPGKGMPGEGRIGS